MVLHQLQCDNDHLWKVVSILEVIYKLNMAQQQALLDERRAIIDEFIAASMATPRFDPSREDTRVAIEQAIADILPPPPPSLEEVFGFVHEDLTPAASSHVKAPSRAFAEPAPQAAAVSSNSNSEGFRFGGAAPAVPSHGEGFMFGGAVAAPTIHHETECGSRGPQDPQQDGLPDELASMMPDAQVIMRLTI